MQFWQTNRNSTVLGSATRNSLTTYTVPTFTATFNGNGGKWGSNKTNTTNNVYGSKLSLPSSTPTLTIGTYTATFNGYYTAASGGTKVTMSTTYSVASNSTYYAQWTLPSGVFDFGDSFAFAVPEKKTLTDARNNCKKYGGELATLNTLEKNNTVTEYLRNSGYDRRYYIWIGLSDEGSEGTWYWLDGTPMTWTNWRAGEPNNSGGAENYAGIDISDSYVGTWVDLPIGYQTISSICEVKK